MPKMQTQHHIGRGINWFPLLFAGYKCIMLLQAQSDMDELTFAQLSEFGEKVGTYFAGNQVNKVKQARFPKSMSLASMRTSENHMTG